MWSQLKNFYKENRSVLEKNYPGITLHRLWQEWESLDHFGHRDSYECYHAMYSSLFPSFCQKLQQGIPLAYISGQTYFYNMTLHVGSDVLIPRFETEILVEMALNWANTRQSAKPLSLVDVGTGSGAILLAFLRAYQKPAKALGIDLSEQALNYASYNEFLTAYGRPNCHTVSWQLGDRLNGVNEKFDLILSNPPYISSNQKQSVHWQVEQYEPHMALFLREESYLNWYQTFFSQCFSLLNPEGLVILEGDPDWLPTLLKLAIQEKFEEAKIINDLQQRPRFLTLRILNHDR